MADDDEKIQGVPVERKTVNVVGGDCSRLGMSQRELVRRVLNWYGAQDDVTRGAVTDTLPPSVAADAAEITLKRLASKGKGK